MSSALSASASFFAGNSAYNSNSAFASNSAQQLYTILHISIPAKVQKRLNNPFGRTPSLLAINSTFSVSTINANPNCQMGDDDPLDEQPFKRMKISTNILLWKPLECFVSVCSWTETCEPLINAKNHNKCWTNALFYDFPSTIPFFVEI